ncbi:MAG: cysteine desulfurase [Elusimicrobia bacterium]|nr:cysteine desulfurase [Elusimicrobiota bacterium]MDE2237974.1 cysteine desulfurase [Elusimicrobiota bacterium]MDE2424542.1 cysteine desulfurase [Elusimicrobiota bacterium]
MIDLDKVRADFPILARRVRGKPLVYLDNAATSQKPRQVIAALVDFYQNHNANIHRGVHTLSDEATALVEEARRKVAAFIRAPKPETIVFTRNATESINLVARSWAAANVRAGEEIVLTELEHHSNLVPWQQLSAERGVVLKFVPILADGTLDLSALPALLGRKTKLVSFTAASNALGTLVPVEAIIRAARAVGARVLVDASQWAPHRQLDARAWDADFIVFSAHKMLGPTGIGVLYGREELLAEMPPFLGGGDMISRVTLRGFAPNVLPHKFEAGTPNIAGAAAFAAALDYLGAVGLSRIVEHERELTRRAVKALSAEPGVTVYGPDDLARRGGVVSFNVEGLHPHDVGTALDLEGVAVRAGHHCCQPLMARLGVGGTVRASFYLYNSSEEVDLLLAALRKAISFFRPAAA